MLPFATLLVAFAVLLATRTKPCGITIVLIGSAAIAAMEFGPTLPSTHVHAKAVAQIETSRVQGRCPT